MDPKIRDSVSILRSLVRKNSAELNGTATAHGVAIRSFDESPNDFMRRLYERVSGRKDFDTAFSALSLIQSLLDEPGPARDPATSMRQRLQQSVQSNLDEIKAEDVRADREFMKALKCL